MDQFFNFLIEGLVFLFYYLIYAFVCGVLDVRPQVSPFVGCFQVGCVQFMVKFFTRRIFALLAVTCAAGEARNNPTQQDYTMKTFKLYKLVSNAIDSKTLKQNKTYH